MYCSRLALSLNKIGSTSAKENHSQVDIPILDEVVLYSMALEYSTIFLQPMQCSIYSKSPCSVSFMLNIMGKYMNAMVMNDACC